jgi:UDP-glucose:(heptosyl)LPS alpha-1,3-glucosyltransferase
MRIAGPGGVVVYRRTGTPAEIDAIDEHSRKLVAALTAIGAPASYEPGGLTRLLASGSRPEWVLLQYNPFRFGRCGFAPMLVRDARRLRQIGVPVAVMVHEAWVDPVGWRNRLIRAWQRAQLSELLRVTDGVMATTASVAHELGQRAVHIPVATNISPVPTSREDARAALGLDGRLTVALFGRANPSRALGHAEAAIAALAQAHGANNLTIMNLGADAPTVRVPLGVEVHTPGALPPDELSLRLVTSDLVLLPTTDGVSTRRGTVMAALAHGRPVLGLRGRNTDAVLARAEGAMFLTPADDRAAFAEAAVELTRDPDRLRAIGAAGRELYESHFDWPATARSVAAVIEAVTARRRGVVFVAHDVGETGGMERQSERLVNLVLDTGRPVTVVARSCALAERENLRFVKVRTPRRPASLGYPAFFALASLLVARRRGALLHTTGAIVANRTDVSTVHYCHRAAVTQVVGSRASRPALLYRLNSALHDNLSLLAEAWCYRPARASMLCAVSPGVAAELRERFPAMAGSVRTVPNGVDHAVFRPDPSARREVRAELGLDDSDQLALFVGGDWERKGLAYAVDALALAPGWQLAVAGAGDPAPHRARARAAGTESRLRFLGSVTEMPRIYAAGDAFILPTMYEAFPLVALEAAASGLPLLVTRVNGVEDLLEDGRGGWFITRDSTDIARRLTRLRSQPDLASQMAFSARTAASRFSWEAMADGYLSLYDELTCRGG